MFEKWGSSYSSSKRRMNTLFCLAVLMLMGHVLSWKLRSLGGCRLNLRVVGSPELCSSPQQRFASPTKPPSLPASNGQQSSKLRKKVSSCPSSELPKNRAQSSCLRELNDSSEKTGKIISANLPVYISIIHFLALTHSKFLPLISHHNGRRIGPLVQPDQAGMDL
jgi:hypothetical protein